ncbi:hypothetical protein JW707_03155 [Candidatus Woesearchaeota archaeon]|nr:hypothetical protein [Candidatus Woesearchaeota archaeon]
MKIKLAVLLLVLVLIPAAAGRTKTGSINLLAMSEIEEGIYKGSLADLSLEIREGKGRVFVNTFPISKIDTQISMRFAQQIACRHAKADCSEQDFIYTIKADSSIIGGPSAGAAAAMLTYSLLANQKLNSSIAITGTINSGEIIGPVGGIKSKIEAASEAGIKTVLVPRGSSEKENETDLAEYGKELNVDVIEVSTLGEALYYSTGKKDEEPKKELVVDPQYKKIMRQLAVQLCDRTDYLQNIYLTEKPEIELNEDILESDISALEDKGKSQAAFEIEDYYTAASYCFRANIDYSYLLYYFKNMTSVEILNKTEQLSKEIETFDEFIDSQEISTITDLQAYMITKERIGESEDRRKVAIENINDTKEAVYWLAFAQERLNSAESWSNFFGTEGQDFIIDNETLKESCYAKISEAEERYQYVNFYFENTLASTRKEIDSAKKDMKEENYIMCLYKASRAKAQADTVMGMIGVEASMLNETLRQKIDAAKQTIIEQQEAGVFPIMGYSYLEYANSLKEEDASSAVIYAEYALELSSFDFYFEKRKPAYLPDIDNNLLFILVLGICIGYVIAGRFAKKRQGKNPKPKHEIRVRSAKLRPKKRLK